MKKIIYTLGAFFIFTLWGNTSSANTNTPNQAAIENQVRRIIRWQLDHFSYSASGNLHDNGIASWTHAVLYRGLSEWATMRKEGCTEYWDWLLDIGTKSNWKMNGIYPYHADEFGMGQFFTTMHAQYEQDEMLSATIARMEWVMNNPPKPSMSYTNKESWTWCDALFMAPPLYARIADLKQDNRYIEFMDKEFRKTYNYLFDRTECLFYRDDSYFGKKENNGKKVFWGRGNGWAIAGIATILITLPTDSPYRRYYENRFRELALSLIRLQGSNGAWHASLLDPDRYPAPETSCTALITYALAYGLNNKLLTDQEAYQPVIKAWNVLCEAIHESGKLGWIQPIGQDPKRVTKEMTATFGVGAFLMAATEMYKLAQRLETGIQNKANESLFTDPETLITIYNEGGVMVISEKLENRTYEEIVEKKSLLKGIYIIVLRNRIKCKTIKYVIDH